MNIQDIIELLPKGEIIAARYLNSKDDLKYVITRSGGQRVYGSKVIYKLYSFEDDKLTYTQNKSEDPLDLEDFMHLD